MFRKNTGSQYLYFALIKASDGTALTGATVTGKRSIDGAAQASVTGTITEDAGGQYHLALSAGDTNGNNIGYLFTATSAVPVNISIVTTAADPTDAVRFGLSALPAGAMVVKKNQAVTGFTFLMVDSTDTPKTGATIVAQRSIDGAAFASCANSAVELGSGVYKIDLATTDMNGSVIMLLFTASGAKNRYITILTQP
jgi:hypothetical protein